MSIGKNHSQDFDVQIASTTISFIQYIIPSAHKKANNNEAIGSIS